MANDLRLQVLLQALDRASTPLQRIGGASHGAADALRATRDSLRKLDQLQAQVGDFRRLKRGTRDNEVEIDRLQATIGELSAKIRANDGDVAQHERELKRATRAVTELRARHEQESAQLQVLRTRLGEAGINTRQLSEAERRLRTDAASTTARLQQQTEALRAQAIQAQRLANIERAGASHRAAQAAAGSALLGTTAVVAGAGYALARVLGAGNDFDYQLQLIGNTADMTGTQVAALRDKIMLASKATGQSARDVEEGIGFLVAAGMNTDTAGASITTIGRTATATGANIEDVSKAAFTLTDALAIRPEGLMQAMDMLAQAGKEGNFELKDMAAVLPQFGAAFKSMKMQGPEAVATLGAALEVARKGAGSAEEAATNMANFFQKLMAPDTLKKAKANFGIDLYKVIANAQSKGANPFEASMRAIMKMTGGDMKKLGELFQDAQVQRFVLPMMQNWKEYERTKAKSLAAKGVIDRDFAKVQATAKQQLKELANAAGRLGDEFSHVLKPAIGGVAAKLTPLLDRLALFIKAHPALVAGVTKAAVAIVGLRVALLGLRYAWAFLGGSAIGGAVARLRLLATTARASSGATVFSRLAEGAKTAFPALARGAGMARAGMLALTGVTLPVIAAVGAVAVAALLIWKYWEPIKAFFTGYFKGLGDVMGPFFDEMREALGPLKPAWDAIAGAIGAVWGWIKQLFEPFHATSEQLKGATDNGTSFGHVVGAVLKGILTPIKWVIEAFVWLGTAIGENAAALTIAIKAPFLTAFEWVEKKIGWLVDKWKALKAMLHIGTPELQAAGMPRNWEFNDGAAPPPRFAPSAPLRAGGGTVQYHTNVGGITVVQRPGENSADFAKRIKAEIAAHERAKASARNSRMADHE